MDPRRQDLTLDDGFFAGSDITLKFTVYDLSDPTVSPAPIKVITGWTLQWKLETTQGAAATLTKSGTVTDGPNGLCSVQVASADTSALTPATYWHVLSRTDSGFNAVLAFGRCVLQGR